MDITYMNSKNCKTSDSYRLLLRHSDEIDLKRSDKYVALTNVSIYETRENIKSHSKALNLKYLDQHGMKNSHCQMDPILYQIFKTILSISTKNMKHLRIIFE